MAVEVNYTTNDMTEESCVARGVLWLDANRPGWRDHIEVERFDIGSPCRCVCGFEFADEARASTDDTILSGFDYAYRMFEAKPYCDEDGVPRTWTVWHGFDADDTNTSWAGLQVEWDKELGYEGPRDYYG